MDGIIEGIKKLEMLVFVVTTYIMSLDLCYNLVVKNITQHEVIILGFGVLLTYCFNRKFKV